MLIMYSSYCQLHYTRPPTICNIKFWTDASSKSRWKIPWMNISTVDAGGQANDFDKLVPNWVSTHFDQYQDFAVENYDGWQESSRFQFASDEMISPFYQSNAIEHIDTEPCSEDESVALRDVVYSDEVQPFKRIHFTKSKDAHHCVDRVMDLFVAISSLIVERDQQGSDFRSTTSPIRTQSEQTLQQLSLLRDRVLQDSHHHDHSNSMTVLMLSLSTIRRLKSILASIRSSSRFTLDVFNIMRGFLRQVNSIRKTHESFQSSKIPSLIDGSILTINRPSLRIFANSGTTQDFQDYRRPSPRRYLRINRLTDGSGRGNATAV